MSFRWITMGFPGEMEEAWAGADTWHTPELPDLRFREETGKGEA